MTNESTEGQVSIFDQDLWFGKMSRACFPQVSPLEKTSESSSKRRRELPTVTPQFLDCRTDTVGLGVGSFWETDGLSLGAYTPQSFGVAPNVVIESRLSQILEVNPHPKYCLSAKACQGILNRATKRGKELPPILKEALENQVLRLSSGGGSEVDANGRKAGKGALIEEELSGTLGAVQDIKLVTSKCYGISPYESNAMKSSNPESGIYEADSARTLDNQGGNPACNQGGIAIVEPVTCYSQFKYDKYLETETSASIKQAGGNIGGGSETIAIQSAPCVQEISKE